MKIDKIIVCIFEKVNDNLVALIIYFIDGRSLLDINRDSLFAIKAPAKCRTSLSLCLGRDMYLIK